MTNNTNINFLKNSTEFKCQCQFCSMDWKEHKRRLLEGEITIDMICEFYMLDGVRQSLVDPNIYEGATCQGMRFVAYLTPNGFLFLFYHNGEWIMRTHTYFFEIQDFKTFDYISATVYLDRFEEAVRGDSVLNKSMLDQRSLLLNATGGYYPVILQNNGIQVLKHMAVEAER